jgi:uncharacterized protein VirK/YbjX
VAIEDSRKDLFKNICCILFIEILFLCNFVKELSSGAISSKLVQETLLSDQIVVLLVLVELEELQDIWMVLNRQSEKETKTRLTICFKISTSLISFSFSSSSRSAFLMIFTALRVPVSLT